MNNFDQLPLNTETIERLKSFAALHRQYTGILVQLIAVDEQKRHILFSLSSTKASLTAEELIKNTIHIFEEEFPAHTQLYFTTMPEGSRFYKTWDDQYLIEVKKGFKIWEIEKILEKEERKSWINEAIQLLKDAKTRKAEKWLQQYEKQKQQR